MKKLLCLLMGCVLILTSACSTGGSSKSENSNSAETSNSAEEGDGKTSDTSYKIGINLWGQANFFARALKSALEEEIPDLGCEVVTTITADTSSRSNAIENLVSQGCDAIIICEGDINEVSSSVMEAKEQGIVIGSLDSGSADFVDIYVSSDNTSLGTAAAEQMVELIGGKGKVVEIINDAASMTRARVEAMHEYLADYPEVEIVSSFTYAWPDYYPDTTSKMEAILQANSNPGDIQAVFASFDGVGLAAVEVIKEFGLENDIVVVGVDGDPDAYTEMRNPDSCFKATLAQDPDTMARRCAQIVVDILNGKTPENKVEYLPGIIITQDNIPEPEENF